MKFEIEAKTKKLAEKLADELKGLKKIPEIKDKDLDVYRHMAISHVENAVIMLEVLKNKLKRR
jgi:hypothetical protein